MIQPKTGCLMERPNDLRFLNGCVWRMPGRLVVPGCIADLRHTAADAMGCLKLQTVDR